ncbi:Glycosyltransferase involved in cell wall bisynthesis [Saccharopolyspora antimicrobica]|uniref:Glycosyltransferase involved in cell wall biosynthesis n=1 Tax=Saccharopolyspora antimicrobica TaxID=455193 RepID=A0A1I5H4A5_9PSEU|nr:glycosyltransferase family 2 protein [Saccharopolyspora antimicrobica]RKT90128.1 glycosyltransferase involved in cell wall biosynthesis [Saccharopolyspora antimicrobica]SFO42970.1 Glycosyltransferase involved in cell wall bisynthesis [Saccharopolyspora antimicrobica]
MYLSLVVPCFNEEHGLQRFHDALVAALSERVRDYEVILVDDGSTDRTLREARRLAAANPRFRYVSLSRNFGKEPAMLCGLRHALGDRVALLDADLQHPPELLRRMLPLLDSGYDQVVACRTRSGERRWRSLPARAYYRAARRFTGVRIPDGAGDFRVLSRRAVEAVLSLPEHHRFSKGLFAWIGFDTAYVSFRDAPRRFGRSKWTFGALVDHGLDGLTSFNAKPLRVSLYLGALLACAAGAWIARATAKAIVDGSRMSVCGALLVGVGGLQLCFLGVLGEYSGRSYFEAKRRPHYLVKELSPDVAGYRPRPVERVP